MKFLIKIFLVISILFTFWINISQADDAWLWWNSSTNYDGWWSSSNQYDQKVNSDLRMWDNWLNNNHLNKLWWDSNFIKTNVSWENGIYYFLLKAAQSIKNIFLVLATIYFLITALKLLLAEGSSDEQFWKFKNWFKWITAWIIVMQIAYSYVLTIYNQKVNTALAGWIVHNIIEPLVKLLETAVAFFFIWVMIFAFYKIITAWWEEEKAKQWKMSVLYAFMWFIIIKLSSYFVSATYSKTLCNLDWVQCINEKKLSDNWHIIFTVINWLNWFVWIVVVLMIMYAGFQIIFSNWEEEKVKKARKAIIYIIIWILILIFNYFILTFFLQDNFLKNT